MSEICDVVLIGSGPDGHTATLHTARVQRRPFSRLDSSIHRAPENRTYVPSVTMLRN